MTASHRPDKKNLSSTQCISLSSLKAVQKVFVPALKSPTTSAGAQGASKPAHCSAESPLPHYSSFQLLWQQSRSQYKQVSSSKARVSILRCLFRTVLCSFITFPQIYLKFCFAPSCHLNTHLPEPKAELWDIVEHWNYLEVIFVTKKKFWSASPTSPQSNTAK